MPDQTTCLYSTENEERAHLAEVRDIVEETLREVSSRVTSQYMEVMRAKQYLQAGRGSMDHVEKITERQSIDQLSRAGEHWHNRELAYARLVNTPWFGRIDFRASEEKTHTPLYIGVHSFQDPASRESLIHDWRAPISAMFYDQELGPAHYQSLEGTVHGDIGLKRQYRIEGGELKFMFETSLNIQDAVLQEELGRAKGDQMKNIVATLQRDQNAIIRNEEAHTLVLQGAAGSGKTSIALHRIAYLLYRHRDELSSNEILILSPNKVFAHYISQVLPELGEQMIKETTMEELAHFLLKYRFEFETFAEQVNRLVESPDEGYVARIRYKSSLDFLAALEDYAAQVTAANIHVDDVVIELPFSSHTVPAAYLRDRLLRDRNLSFTARITLGVQAVNDHLRSTTGKELPAAQRALVRKRVQSMFRRLNLQTIYREFYLFCGRPDLHKPASGGRLEHADVFPLIYLGMLLEGLRPDKAIKHLLIDEMQDYTPVHYKVLAALFPCRKTILGDVHQSLNPYSASPAETIGAILPNSICVYMHKSYRSTIEITRLAQRILPNPELQPIERHGDAPIIRACGNVREELEAVKEEIRQFLASEHKSMGIVCKSPYQTEMLHNGLKELRDQVQLIDTSSTLFQKGVLLTTAHLAKGLEFDRVLVPFCSDLNYSSPVDRHLLYVACTRALHRLTLTHHGAPSSFLQPKAHWS